ncbi:MAG TPA: periplasmic heavy metal sensor [Caulobacteraceae bacterium]|jgi:uncharacterized membrane protein
MRPRWLVIGLVVSLALNLFLIGAGAGIIALGSRLARENGGERVAALFWATQKLPRTDRRQIRAMLTNTRQQVRADADRSLALRMAAWSALADPRPDTAAIEQQLAQSRQIDVATRAVVEHKVTAYVAAMPPADRAIVAAGMQRALSKRSTPPH